MTNANGAMGLFHMASQQMDGRELRTRGGGEILWSVSPQGDPSCCPKTPLIPLPLLARVHARRLYLLVSIDGFGRIDSQRLLPLCGIVCANLPSYSDSAVGVASAERPYGGRPSLTE